MYKYVVYMYMPTFDSQDNDQKKLVNWPTFACTVDPDDNEMPLLYCIKGSIAQHQDYTIHDIYQSYCF